MRPCMATDCRSPMAVTLRTREAGLLDVCDAHAAVLRSANEVVDGPELIRISTGAAIVKPPGRPPKVLANVAEAVARVEAGEPLGHVAKDIGIDRNTLKRRVENPPDVAAPEPDPLATAETKLGDARKRRERAAMLRKQADGLDAEAAGLVREARALMDLAIGDSP